MACTSGQLVDQHEHLGRIGAEVEAHRGAGPVDLLGGAGLEHQIALAVAHARGDGGRDFLAADVAVRPALLAEGLGDDLGEAFGGLAEEIGHRLERALLVEGLLVGGLGGEAECGTARASEPAPARISRARRVVSRMRERVSIMVFSCGPTTSGPRSRPYAPARKAGFSECGGMFRCNSGRASRARGR